MSRKTALFAERFFADLRPAVAHLGRKDKKPILRKIYAKYKSSLSTNLQKFIELYLLTDARAKARLVYCTTNAYLETREKWMLAFSNKRCTNCNSFILGHRGLLFKVTTKEFCSPTCAGNSESTRRKVMATNMERRGVDNPSRDPEVRRKAERTTLTRWGTKYIANSEEAMGESWERWGGRSPFCLASVRLKSAETNTIRYGTPNAMHNTDIAYKCLSKGRNRYKGRLQNKVYVVQGKSEVALLKALVKKYGSKNTDSQFSPSYPRDIFKKTRVLPDFYLTQLDTYVECKSTWTLMGRPGNHPRGLMEGSLARNKAKAKACFDAGFLVRWVVHIRGKGFYLLPTYWYLMPSKEIRRMVANYISSKK